MVVLNSMTMPGTAKPSPRLICSVGRAVKFDERVLISEFLLGDGVLEVGQRVLLGAHETGHILGIVKGGHGVLQGDLGASIDLLEMSAIVGADNDIRIEIESDGVF